MDFSPALFLIFITPFQIFFVFFQCHTVKDPLAIYLDDLKF